MRLSRFLLLLCVIVASAPLFAQTTDVTCSVSPCTVVVQLDATQAIQQLSDAIPAFADVQEIFWGCVAMMLVGFSVRQAKRAAT